MTVNGNLIEIENIDYFNVTEIDIENEVKIFNINGTGLSSDSDTSKF